MVDEDFPVLKLGFHGHESSSTPSTTSSLLIEETRHLIYMFCERGESIKLRPKSTQGSTRSYCSLCRHFHKGFLLDSEGVEKHFPVKAGFKEFSSSRSLGRNHTIAKGKGKDDQRCHEKSDWKTLVVEGFRIHGVNASKDVDRTENGKREVQGCSNHLKKYERLLTARFGCAVCEKPRKSYQENRAVSLRNNVINIVLPSTDCKLPFTV